ncbi:hypothetical protein CVT26_013952 [Gymnopilus dilepis]|uniref:Uncharacterized protein n=1 Tax=Gymnopilus dilepis TaxID=231916 RepID=A0A409X018_9AGAR|nr:hypothetical protein CVT26_013952 [Gymnopilus dilepis]
MQPQILVRDLHGEVERRRFVYPVDGVHVAVFVREDVLEDVRGAVGYAVGVGVMGLRRGDG